ncbi:MAG: ABC transporter permease [Elusimicrobia bacterium]|nr:ABC transporter permease [Elusimicrobiota bacterium]
MALIELQHISKTYHMGTVDVPALKNISLEISEGEFVAIMGQSGSGKSTLLNLLGLLDKPSSGTYKLSEKEVSKLNDEKLASLRNKYIGFVFQQFNLLPRMNALENVSLPLVYSSHKEKNLKEIEFLIKVGLADRVYHKPNELSGGQQQRVAIARSLINNPLLILADEPTGNLDSKSSIEIMNILKELNDSGITIIMVTHEINIADFAHRIIKVSDGVIISDQKKQSVHREHKISKPVSETHKTLKIEKIKEYFSQAMRSMFSNKIRSILSILGVLIGVASLIAMLALGRGAQEDVKKNLSSLGSNLLFIRAGPSRSAGISLGSGTVTRLTLLDEIAIRDRIAGVNRIVSTVGGRGQLTYGGKNWNTQIYGTGSDYPVMHNSSPSEGRFFTPDEVTSRAKVALIGWTVRKNLFGNENPIGKFIRVMKIDFQVIGILPTKGSSGWRDYDDMIAIPVNTAMYRVLGKEYVDSIEVQVIKLEDMDLISEKIKNLLAALHRLSFDRKNEIEIRNMADVQQAITQATRTFTLLLGSIALISLIVGGIGIMNIMLVSVTERTREIGIRKAVGANNKDIMFQFIIEAIVVCLIGGILGILLGCITAIAMSKFVNWNILISWYSVFLALIFSGVTGIVFGVWPAKKAANLNPIDALRYE